jgi:hypothetical protein
LPQFRSRCGPRRRIPHCLRAAPRGMGTGRSARPSAKSGVRPRRRRLRRACCASWGVTEARERSGRHDSRDQGRYIRAGLDAETAARSAPAHRHVMYVEQRQNSLLCALGCPLTRFTTRVSPMTTNPARLRRLKPETMSLVSIARGHYRVFGTSAPLARHAVPFGSADSSLTVGV